MTLRGLWIQPRDGRPFYRSRRGGKVLLVPLPADLPHDHPDFIAAWAAAARGRATEPPPKGGTIASATASLAASDRWHVLSEGYRRLLDGHRRKITDAYGRVMLRAVREPHIRRDVTGATDPRGRLKFWRLLIAHAIDRGLIETDPSAAVKPPRRPAAQGRAPWTPEHIAAFRARWPIGTVPRAAMELMHWTGCRVSDSARIGPQMVGADGVLAYRQGKTGGPAFVPWTCALPPYAAHMAEDRAMMHRALAPFAGALLFLPSHGGRPRSIKALTQAMLRACTAAGVPVTSHGFRATRAQSLVDGGATPHQAASWTGHESLAELTHYARGLDRRAAVTGTPPEQPTGNASASSGNAAL